MEMLWLEQVWRKGKKVSEAMSELEFFDLLRTIERDFSSYLEARERNEEVFVIDNLSKEELIERRNDVKLLISNIQKHAERLIIRAYNFQEKDAEKVWRERLCEKTIIVCRLFLPMIHKELTFEMLLREGKRYWLKYILEKDWNPRRKQLAQQMIEQLSV